MNEKDRVWVVISDKKPETKTLTWLKVFTIDHLNKTIRFKDDADAFLKLLEYKSMLRS